MTKAKLFIKRHPTLIYFILAIAISWGCIVMVVGPSKLPVDPDDSEDILPLMYMAMLAGPTFAGLVLTSILSGRAGFSELFTRMRLWRVELRWYAMALLTAPIVVMAVLSILSLFSSAFKPEIVTSDDKLTLLLSGIFAGLMVGAFEEIGWTGFALPHLRSQHNLTITGLILGIVWGIWHFLPFWADDSFTKTLPFAILLAQLFAWLPPYRMLMVLVHERTQSLLLVIIMHAMLLASLQIFVPAALSDGDLLTWLIAWAVALWAIAAVAVGLLKTHTADISIQLQREV